MVIWILVSSLSLGASCHKYKFELPKLFAELSQGMGYKISPNYTHKRSFRDLNVPNTCAVHIHSVMFRQTYIYGFIDFKCAWFTLSIALKIGWNEIAGHLIYRTCGEMTNLVYSHTMGKSSLAGHAFVSSYCGVCWQHEAAVMHQIKAWAALMKQDVVIG